MLVGRSSASWLDGLLVAVGSSAGYVVFADAGLGAHSSASADGHDGGARPAGPSVRNATSPSMWSTVDRRPHERQPLGVGVDPGRARRRRRSRRAYGTCSSRRRRRRRPCAVWMSSRSAAWSVRVTCSISAPVDLLEAGRAGSSRARTSSRCRRAAGDGQHGERRPAARRTTGDAFASLHRRPSVALGVPSGPATEGRGSDRRRSSARLGVGRSSCDGPRARRARPGGRARARRTGSRASSVTRPPMRPRPSAARSRARRSSPARRGQRAPAPSTTAVVTIGAEPLLRAAQDELVVERPAVGPLEVAGADRPA